MISPPCIYKIYNKKNRMIYIGSTKSFLLRQKYHLQDLKDNKHCNYRLQRDFNAGVEFVFQIVEIVPDITMLIQREQYWINTLKPKYNIYPYAELPKKIVKKIKKKRLKKNKTIADTWYPDRKLK